MSVRNAVRKLETKEMKEFVLSFCKSRDFQPGRSLLLQLSLRTINFHTKQKAALLPAIKELEQEGILEVRGNDCFWVAERGAYHT